MNSPIIRSYKIDVNQTLCGKRQKLNLNVDVQPDVKTELNKLPMKRPIIGNDNVRVVSTETLEMADA